MYVIGFKNMNLLKIEELFLMIKYFESNLMLFGRY